MIMPRGHQLLLPANQLFIIFSLVFAFLIDMLLSMAFTGNT
ncbi:MAG: rod shape-determining protein MreD, partial [Betaproteobacteria bacterium]